MSETNDSTALLKPRKQPITMFGLGQRCCDWRRVDGPLCCGTFDVGDENLVDEIDMAGNQSLCRALTKNLRSIPGDVTPEWEDAAWSGPNAAGSAVCLKRLEHRKAAENFVAGKYFRGLDPPEIWRREYRSKPLDLSAEAPPIACALSSETTDFDAYKFLFFNAYGKTHEVFFARPTATYEFAVELNRIVELAETDSPATSLGVWSASVFGSAASSPAANAVANRFDLELAPREEDEQWKLLGTFELSYERVDPGVHTPSGTYRIDVSISDRGALRGLFDSYVEPVLQTSFYKPTGEVWKEANAIFCSAIRDEESNRSTTSFQLFSRAVGRQTFYPRLKIEDGPPRNSSNKNNLGSNDIVVHDQAAVDEINRKILETWRDEIVPSELARVRVVPNLTPYLYFTAKEYGVGARILDDGTLEPYPRDAIADEVLTAF